MTSRRMNLQCAKMPLTEFRARFGTEEQCRRYLQKKRWPYGFVCPRCGGRRCYYLSNGSIQCAFCYHQTSLTAGTIMHKSHVPLTKWFEAMYMIAQTNDRVTAVKVQETLNVAYKTAWYLLSRIRSATTPATITYVCGGRVEFDDALFETLSYDSLHYAE